MYCTNLFVVFDLIVEDNAIGSLWLLPGQGHTVSRRLLLSDHCDRGGSWMGDIDRHRAKERERVSSSIARFSASSVSGVASWQLSMVPVSLIQFAARWGRIKGPELMSGTRRCTLMQTLPCAYKDTHRLKHIYCSTYCHFNTLFCQYLPTFLSPEKPLQIKPNPEVNKLSPRINKHLFFCSRSLVL